jgi:hypothetical protein
VLPITVPQVAALPSLQRIDGPVALGEQAAEKPSEVGATILGNILE